MKKKADDKAFKEHAVNLWLASRKENLRLSASICG